MDLVLDILLSFGAVAGIVYAAFEVKRNNAA